MNLSKDSFLTFLPNAKILDWSKSTSFADKKRKHLLSALLFLIRTCLKLCTAINSIKCNEKQQSLPQRLSHGLLVKHD